MMESIELMKLEIRSTKALAVCLEIPNVLYLILRISSEEYAPDKRSEEALLLIFTMASVACIFCLVRGVSLEMAMLSNVDQMKEGYDPVAGAHETGSCFQTLVSFATIPVTVVLIILSIVLNWVKGLDVSPLHFALSCGGMLGTTLTFRCYEAGLASSKSIARPCAHGQPDEHACARCVTALEILVCAKGGIAENAQLILMRNVGARAYYAFLCERAAALRDQRPAKLPPRVA